LGRAETPGDMRNRAYSLIVPLASYPSLSPGAKENQSGRDRYVSASP